MLALTLKGLLIGLAVAAPVGPMALLCLKLSLERGIGAGIATGFGIAVADMTYGALALLGLTAVMALLLDYSDFIRTVGGSALILMAIYSTVKILREKKIPKAAALDKAALDKKLSGKLILSFSSAYALTITNPMTILTFLAIFSGLGADAPSSDRWIIASGVFFGSLGWWLTIALIGSFLKTRIPKSFIKVINWLSALVIGGFGVFILVT